MSLDFYETSWWLAAELQMLLMLILWWAPSTYGGTKSRAVKLFGRAFI